ncbi:hypothetical protein [Brevibacterium aurantiacum]|uniref:Uncharacterized protein n=1 Tax=Brevibacterium aurantiacum TaxID=273384 RepID=A0A2A3ZSI3_BREAU|nr:hypothetical protein [Brevibacterium aurantiacum]AZT94394.1 hypothetical protein CXR23_15590 [Brevibacterium aurantiacum]AZT98165.1 hypothetical protein CXR27_15050 [Brevibacterium aurantiacum]PCC54514.1 hypothetical protein CIK59_05710 [Brevibacterium aurantiacum]
MPPSSLLPTRLPAFRLLVLGIVLGLVVLILGPAQSPAAAADESPAAGSAPAAAASSTAASTTSASAGTGSAGEDSDASRPPDGKTIVYGIPGLTINDIDPVRTPNLYELFSNGSAANLNVRTIGSATCPGSGWLSMGAGARAQAGPPTDPELEGSKATCPALSAPSSSDEAAEKALDGADEAANSAAGTSSSSDEDLPGQAAKGTTTATIDDFEAIKEPNVDSGYSVDYGMLARLVREQGKTVPQGTEASSAASQLEPCVAAEGPGAAYAAADQNGVVANYTDDAAATDCRLGLVDLGSIGSSAWLYDPIPNYSYTVPVFFDREERVAEADERLGDKLEEVRDSAAPGSEEPTIIVAGLGDSSGLPQLRAFIASGPGYEPGNLSSASTRTPGLLQLTDIAPGILDQFGISSPNGISFDVTPTEDEPDERIDDLVSEAQKATSIYQHLSTFSLLLDIIFYVLFILCGVLLARNLIGRRGGARTVPTVHRFLAWVSFAAATLPMSAFVAGLFPWARLPHPGFGLSVSIAVSAALLFCVSLLPPWGRTWRGRVAALSLLSFLILSADLITGSHLQGNSLLGYNPIVGGRYYGLGNQGAAIFIVSLFIFLGIAISWLRARGHRRLVFLLPLVLGLFAVFVSGNPSWGAKFGGTIATLAGLLVLLALVSRIRLSIFRLVLIGLASLAVLLGIAFLDWLREPGSRSHFGTFFDQIVTGEALQVIGRKLGANLHIVAINPALAIVTPLAIIAILFFLRYLLHFPSITPATRAGRLANKWRGRLPQVFEDQDIHFGFLAAVTGMAVGLVITDSGIAVPSTGAMVLLPYLLALSAEHAQETIADTKPRRGSTRTILMSAEDASEPQGAPKSGTDRA